MATKNGRWNQLHLCVFLLGLILKGGDLGVTLGPKANQWFPRANLLGTRHGDGRASQRGFQKNILTNENSHVQPRGFWVGCFFCGTYICIYKQEPDFSIKNLSIFRGSQRKSLKWFHFDMLIRHQNDDWMYSEMGIFQPAMLVYQRVRYRCFLKWWYPQNTPKWSFLVGTAMVVGYHLFRKPPYSDLFDSCFLKRMYFHSIETPALGAGISAIFFDKCPTEYIAENATCL